MRNRLVVGTKMNDLDLCLEVVSRSRQPLRCMQRSLSRKPLEIEAWFQRSTNRIGFHMGFQMWCEAVWSAILATVWLLVFIFCSLWCAIMPLTGVINYVFTFTFCCFIASLSYRTRIVIKQSIIWSHSHSLNTYTTHFWYVIAFFKFSVIFTWQLLHTIVRREEP